MGNTNRLSNPFDHIIPGSAIDRRRHWIVFRAFNYYRLALIALLLLIVTLDEGLRVLSITDNKLFISTLLVYLGLVVVALITSLVRFPSFYVQVHLQTVVDLIIFGLLIHASGGLGSTLLVLLVVTMAAAAIMLPLVSTFITAVLASLTVVLLWLHPLWLNAESTHALLAAFDLSQHGNSIAQISSYTAEIFIVMLVTYSIAERGRHSERLAQQHAHELLDLARVNQAIVQHLQSGVIVVDRLARVRLLNSTAREQLNCHNAPDDERPLLGMLSPALSQRWKQWLHTGLNDTYPFRPADHLPETTPYFSYLGEEDSQKPGDTLIVLEDSNQVAQRVQRIKLVALGRLTASIAHEIRNPLSSISHASQLLDESPTAGDSDKRLAQIIHNNAKRASNIITNVLDLSRRERAELQDIQLRPWLENFCNEFLRGYQGELPHIEVRVQPKELRVLFDSGHLHQIVWNLVGNACTHGAHPDTQPQITLQAGFDGQRQRPLLDIIDAGPGIPQADQGRIFEPFFTSKTRGNGLGLYISREICEANRSQLQYLNAAGGGSCFRVLFGSHRNARSQILNVTEQLND